MRKLILTALLTVSASSAAAEQQCIIDRDIVSVLAVEERSIPLTNFEDVVIRAASGTVRCEEDSTNGRMVCLVEGQGELVIDAPDAPTSTITFVMDEVGEAHVYPTGDLTCALKSEFDKYR